MHQRQKQRGGHSHHSYQRGDNDRAALRVDLNPVKVRAKVAAMPCVGSGPSTICWGLLRWPYKSRDGVDALCVFPSPMLYAEYGRIVSIVAEKRLPTIYAAREGVELGGLMSYGANLADLARQTASYVDKILKGAKPAELPVQQPTKFELVINLKTAKALGLTFT